MMVTVRIAFVFLAVVFGTYMILTNDIGTRMDVIWLKTDTNITDDIPNEAFDTCVLRVYDPVFKDMKKVVPYQDADIDDLLEVCNKTFTPPTELINGMILMNPLRDNEFDGCSASCLYYVTAQKADADQWQNFTNSESVKLDCDTIWTKCYKNNKTVDQGVHLQVVEVEEIEELTSASPRSSGKTTKSTTTTSTTTKPSPDSEKGQRHPNVYVIVVDSVASTQALRTLPKTIDFLKRNMSGVFFHHLNKIGENSRPNGYAMTMGWRIMRMDRSAVGAPNLEPQFNWDTVCNTYRDNDSVIMKEYERAGYKTLYSEDYPAGTIFSWPGCWGFEKQPATHSIRPYVAITSREQMLKKNYRPANCFELSRQTLNFTGMFMKAYKDKPKFGFTWVSTISHDSPNRLYHEDDYFENFFKEHEPQLRDSFVFFMADHGMRYGRTYATELGKRETKNPFLLVTVPEFLRGNDQFMHSLEENSMRLLTQFDVHATLVDLLKIAPKSNFNDFNFTTIFEDNPNNATSILRPLGQFSRRSCRNIPLPFQYCLCEHDLVEVENPLLATDAHKFLTDEINGILKENNVSQLCHHSEPKEINSFKAFAPEYPNRLYEIVFDVKPGGGRYKAHIQYDEPRKTFKTKGEIERVSSYAGSAKCVNSLPIVKPYCYCLNQ